MRSMLLGLVFLCAGLSSPAWAQTWTPDVLGLVQGESPKTVELTFPELFDFDSATIKVSYLGSAFEDLLVTSFSSSVAPIDDLSVTAAIDSPIQGYREVDIFLVVPGNPIHLAPGAVILSMDLQAKSGPASYLGQTTIFTDVSYTTFNAPDEIFADPQPFIVANIAAVPEAETWAMMLAALGLVGFCAARRRNTRA